jgi:hypothetical protein
MARLLIMLTVVLGFIASVASSADADRTYGSGWIVNTIS